MLKQLIVAATVAVTLSTHAYAAGFIVPPYDNDPSDGKIWGLFSCNQVLCNGPDVYFHSKTACQGWADRHSHGANNYEKCLAKVPEWSED